MISPKKLRQLDHYRKQIHEAASKGLNADALRICDDALRWAESQNETILVDRASCNRAAIIISMERGAEVLSPMRALLMRSADATSRHLAAYNISRHHEFEQNAEKGLFYAKIALESARGLERSDWIAASLNQLGNFLIKKSYFAEAAECYRESLASLSADLSTEKSQVQSNLGYALAMLGEHREALRLIFQSLRAYRKIGRSLIERIPRLDLCFTYLEMGRYRRAIGHGLAALAMSEEAGDSMGVKNSLYLLGEATKLSGNTFLARQYFCRLQSDYFPGQDFIPEILLSMDVRGLVNLRA